MTKGCCSGKKAKPSLEGPVQAKEKPSVKPKRMGSEIDEIFAAKKRMKLEKEKNVNNDKPSKALATSAKSCGRKKIVNGSKNKVLKQGVFKDTAPRQKKKTADGLTIYTEEELGIGKSDAGGTRLCPFDCDCCF